MTVDPDSLPRLTINLEHGDTDDEACRVLPLDVFERFTEPNPHYPGYGEIEVNVAILTVPADIEADWWDLPSSRRLRRKVNRAVRLGYEFAPFEHDDYLDDMFEINTSMPERQGMAMFRHFLERPRPRGRLPHQPCPRHRAGWFGVFRDGKLYAYMHVVQAGEVTLTGLGYILGHGDYLDDGIMSLLLYEGVKWHWERAGTRYSYYYLMDANTDGMHVFKEFMGYRGYLVRWELSRRPTSCVNQ